MTLGVLATHMLIMSGAIIVPTMELPSLAVPRVKSIFTSPNTERTALKSDDVNHCERSDSDEGNEFPQRLSRGELALSLGPNSRIVWRLQIPRPSKRCQPYTNFCTSQVKNLNKDNLTISITSMFFSGTRIAWVK
jgi:hypothetical protein